MNITGSSKCLKCGEVLLNTMVHVCNKQSTECMAHGKINCGKCEYWGLPQESASRSDDIGEEIFKKFDAKFGVGSVHVLSHYTYSELRDFISNLISTQRKLDRQRILMGVIGLDNGYSNGHFCVEEDKLVELLEKE